MTQVIVHLSEHYKEFWTVLRATVVPLGILTWMQVMSPFLSLLSISGSHFCILSHMQKFFFISSDSLVKCVTNFHRSSSS